MAGISVVPPEDKNMETRLLLQKVACRNAFIAISGAQDADREGENIGFEASFSDFFMPQQL